MNVKMFKASKKKLSMPPRKQNALPCWMKNNFTTQHTDGEKNHFGSEINLNSNHNLWNWSFKEMEPRVLVSCYSPGKEVLVLTFANMDPITMALPLHLR